VDQTTVTASMAKGTRMNIASSNGAGIGTKES